MDFAQTTGMISLSITLLVHLAGTIWWAAGLTKRVEHIEKWIVSNEHTGERLARLESSLESLSYSMERIERMLSAKL